MVNEGRKTVDASLEELTTGGHTLEELFARETARDVVTAEEEAAAEGAVR